MMNIMKPLVLISIHAPRRGSDMYIATIFVIAIIISIHAPRRGSDIIVHVSTTK